MPVLVALDATPSRAFVDGLLAAWDRGDAVLPVDPRLPAPARAELLAALRPGDPVESGDALVVATSGTTGRPRGAVLTRVGLEAAAAAVTRRLGVDPGTDRWLACLPLAHVAGLGVVVRALLTATAFTFDPGDQAATLVSLVPAQLRRFDLRRFRAVLVGGDVPPPGLPPHAICAYGLTETGGGVVYDGVPLDGVEVRVDGDGQLLVRGPTLMRCYRDGTDPRLPGGWLATGDLGAVVGGRVEVHGRAGDVIVTGGEKVWPSVVEAVLASHAGVADVGVVGRPDPEWGTRVVAVVVPADRSRPPALEDLRAWTKQRLPAYAAPREVVLVDSLDRTGSGKLRRASYAAFRLE